jgi:plastocyanin
MKTIAFNFGTAGLALALFTGCDRGADDEPQTEATVAAAAETAAGVQTTVSEGYAVVDVTNGGTIRGTVAFAGTVPPTRTITIDESTETCGESTELQPIQVGANGGLANAVVSLLDITSGAARVTTSPATLDQDGCRFVPHVLLASVDEAVHVLNSDPLTHNIHTAAFENRPVNRSQPAGVRKIEMTFRSPEKVRVRCDMHSWMDAWIVVVDHPYHSVTDEAGGFVLENVPPGDYTLEIWHETLGANTQPVTVSVGEATDASVEIAQQH